MHRVFVVTKSGATSRPPRQPQTPERPLREMLVERLPVFEDARGVLAQSRFRLEYPLATRIGLVAIATTLAAVAILWGTGVLPFAKRDLLAACALFVVAIGLFIEAYVVTITADSAGLRHRTPWRTNRTILWPQVQRAHRRWSGTVVLETEQGKVRINERRAGGARLWDLLQRKRVPVQDWSSPLHG